MKKFLVLLAFVLVQSAYADGFTAIEKGDLSISEADAKLISVKAICPKVPGRPTCMAYGSTATVKVTLSGCLDRLGGYFTKFEAIDGKGVLYFGALNIFNKKSTVARCVAAPTEIVKVSLPFEGEVEMVQMDYTGMTQPQF